MVLPEVQGVETESKSSVDVQIPAQQRHVNGETATSSRALA